MGIVTYTLMARMMIWMKMTSVIAAKTNTQIISSRRSSKNFNSFIVLFPYYTDASAKIRSCAARGGRHPSRGAIRGLHTGPDGGAGHTCLGMRAGKREDQ